MGFVGLYFPIFYLFNVQSNHDNILHIQVQEAEAGGPAAEAERLSSRRGGGKVTRLPCDIDTSNQSVVVSHRAEIINQYEIDMKLPNAK